MSLTKHNRAVGQVAGEPETTPRMDPVIKAEWVAALRSGEYKQGAGWLNSAEGFCCLGVLCDVVDPSRWGARGRDGVAMFGNEATACLPSSVSRAAGVAMETRISIDGHLTSFVEHNDGRRRTFAQIADAIEAQL